MINQRVTRVSPEQGRAFLAEKSKRNSRRILVFSLFCAYALLAVLGTSDYDILLERPIEIPGLRITLPLISFYMVTPLAILVLHFGILWMHERYRQELQNIPRETIKAIPFSILDASHLGAGRLLKFGVHVLVYLFPPVVLAAFFFRFADYQSLRYTFFHLAFLIICLIIDLVFICKYRWPGKKRDLKIFATQPHFFLFLISIAYFFSFYFFLKSPSEFLEYSSRFLTDNQIKILRAGLPRLEVTHCNLNKGFDLNEAKAYRELDDDKEKRPYLFYTTMVDLRNRKLIMADLSYSKMVNFDFTRADLRKADLNNSQLQYSSFYLAELQGASLEGANFQKVNLKSVELQRANLNNTNLQGALLTGTQLQGAILTYANLQGAILTHTNLQGADLKDTNLQGAILTYANLQRVYLTDTNLQGAILTGAYLEEAYLWWANLQGAILTSAHLQGAILAYANLQGAILTGTQLQGANLKCANFQGACAEDQCTSFVELIERPTQLSHLGNEKLTQEDFERIVEIIKSVSTLYLKYPHYNLENEIKEWTSLVKQAVGKTSLEWLEMQKGKYVTGVLTWKEACKIQRQVDAPNVRTLMGLDKVNWKEKCK